MGDLTRFELKVCPKCRSWTAWLSNPHPWPHLCMDGGRWGLTLIGALSLTCYEWECSQNCWPLARPRTMNLSLLSLYGTRHACDFAYQALPLFSVQHWKAENGPGDEANVIISLPCDYPHPPIPSCLPLKLWLPGNGQETRLNLCPAYTFDDLFLTVAHLTYFSLDSGEQYFSVEDYEVFGLATWSVCAEWSIRCQATCIVFSYRASFYQSVLYYTFWPVIPILLCLCVYMFASVHCLHTIIFIHQVLLASIRPTVSINLCDLPLQIIPWTYIQVCVALGTLKTAPCPCEPGVIHGCQMPAPEIPGSFY